MAAHEDKDRIKAVVCCHVSIALKQAILAYREKHRLKTETETIVQLLQTALFIDSKEEELKDPELVAFLKKRLYDQELVDWAFQLERDRLEALFALIRSARELRYHQRH